MKEQRRPKFYHYIAMLVSISIFVGVCTFCLLFAEHSYRYVQAFQKQGAQVNAEILKLDVAEKCTTNDGRKTCSMEPRLRFQYEHPEFGVKRHRRFISRNLAGRLRQQGLEAGVPISYAVVRPSEYALYFADMIGFDLKESKFEVRIKGEDEDWFFYLAIAGFGAVGVGCGFLALMLLFGMFKTMGGSRRV